MLGKFEHLSDKKILELLHLLDFRTNVNVSLAATWPRLDRRSENTC